MEKNLASDDDKHRITSNKSYMDTGETAEGEKALSGALGGQVDIEPNDDRAGRVDAECAPGSTKDIRV